MTKQHNNQKDQERAKYTNLILEKERQIDQLDTEKRKMEVNIDQLDDDLHRGYKKLILLNEENLHYDGMQEENDDQERQFRFQLQDSREQLTAVYQKALRQADEERESLYEKRRQVPWD
ncbi:hypothetical protein VL806_07875 [Listeria seeligeri]|uniref:hypothetical protein n=1 Tax=Listeria seeligeri TaxID=1640 RepID=UPI0018B07890|nr:hypothetical protein [Listeria seeligeri]QPJ26873.1 hypothetical protein IMX23_01565 [Listeria seeligeri]